MDTKRCSRGDVCVHPDGPELPATTEYFCRAGKQLLSHCKACKSKDARKYYEANRETTIERVRRYRREKPEKTAETSRKYRAKNREAKAEYDRVYYAENRERFAANSRKYRAENSEALSIKNKEYREKNRENLIKRSREYYAVNRKRWTEYYEANRDKILSQASKYYVENREAKSEYNRRYKEENKAKIAEQRRRYSKENPRAAREWAKANPDKVRAKARRFSRRRRTRKRELPFSFTADDERRAISYFNGRCAVCERPLVDLFGEHFAAMDHWIALSDERPDNPGTVPTNMIPLCHGVGGCNNRKHAADPVEWLTSEFGKRKAGVIVARVREFFEWVSGEDGDT